MSKPFQSCLNPFKHARNLENHVLKSKKKKCINLKKSFGWKPYGGKSGSRKTMVIFSRLDFKVFGPNLRKIDPPPEAPLPPRGPEAHAARYKKVLM